MGLFHKSAEKEKLEALEKVISKTNRGIFKRIDENRELLELLYEKAPELIHVLFRKNQIALWILRMRIIPYEYSHYVCFENYSLSQPHC